MSPALLRSVVAQLLGLVAVGSLLGCASRIDVDRDQASLAAARSCCGSVAALPPPLALGAGLDLRLTAESPHFDFGEGLAPFAVVALDPARTRFVELVSTLHTTTLEAGNQHHFRGVVPAFVFLDADRGRLQAPPMSKTAPVLAGPSGQYALSTLVAVPAQARALIIATRISAVGSRHGGCIHPGGSGRPVAHDQCIVYPAGVLKVEDWRGAIYGQARVLALPAPP